MKKFFFVNSTTYHLTNQKNPNQHLFKTRLITWRDTWSTYNHQSRQYYKSIQPQGEQDKQYWNKITIEFLKQKHNADVLRKRFLIKIYMEEPSHKPYFIMLILWEQVIVGPTKKLVVSHVVGDLALLD